MMIDASNEMVVENFHALVASHKKEQTKKTQKKEGRKETIFTRVCNGRFWSDIWNSNGLQQSRPHPKIFYEGLNLVHKTRIRTWTVSRKNSDWRGEKIGAKKESLNQLFFTEILEIMILYFCKIPPTMAITLRGISFYFSLNMSDKEEENASSGGEEEDDIELGKFFSGSLL